MARRTVGGSESDAYRYTKKVLHSLHMDSERIDRYIAEAKKAGESSWERHCFVNLRNRFFHDGISAIKFAPGVARIAYGELDMDDDWAEEYKLFSLASFIRMISEHHATSYTRHLEIDGKLDTYDTLSQKYGTVVTENLAKLKSELTARTYGNRRYTIVWMKNFSVARQYAKEAGKAPGGSWCYLDNADTFNSYTKNNTVKLYIALMDGYEYIGPDDPDYGPSMLGIDIGMNGELVHVNNRWNHLHDSIDERKGDNKYTPEELSDLLGGPYFELCPPFTAEEREEYGFTDKSFSEIIAPEEYGTFIDPRDGHAYRTLNVAGRRWIVDDINYSGGNIKKMQLMRQSDTSEVAPNRGPYYRYDGAELAVPPGCHIPTTDDWEVLINYIGLTREAYCFDYIVNQADVEGWTFYDHNCADTIDENTILETSDDNIIDTDVDETSPFDTDSAQSDGETDAPLFEDNEELISDIIHDDPTDTIIDTPIYREADAAITIGDDQHLVVNTHMPTNPAHNAVKMNLAGFGALNSGIGVFGRFIEHMDSAMYWSSTSSMKYDVNAVGNSNFAPIDSGYIMDDGISEVDPEDECFGIYYQNAPRVMSQEIYMIGPQYVKCRTCPRNMYMRLKCIVDDAA